MMVFIMEIRREFSLFHIEPKSLCSVADYAKKILNDFCFQSFIDVTQRSLSNLQVKKAD